MIPLADVMTMLQWLQRERDEEGDRTQICHRYEGVTPVAIGATPDQAPAGYVPYLDGYADPLEIARAELANAHGKRHVKTSEIIEEVVNLLLVFSPASVPGPRPPRRARASARRASKARIAKPGNAIRGG